MLGSGPREKLSKAEVDDITSICLAKTRAQITSQLSLLKLVFYAIYELQNPSVLKWKFCAMYAHKAWLFSYIKMSC